MKRVLVCLCHPAVLPPVLLPPCAPPCRAVLLCCPACWERLAAAVGGRAALAAPLLVCWTVLVCAGAALEGLSHCHTLPNMLRGSDWGMFGPSFRSSTAETDWAVVFQQACDAFFHILIGSCRARHGVRHLQVLLPVPA